ncbi:MAG: hypothetical protein DLM59_11530 [Pseudonocardiales bacterium]|nr:MAG: hypothetical protein DLM59_11530 [Pseudonocardiales bacterium]
MSENFTGRRTQVMLTGWPDTSGEDPPADHPYRAATWLLGRHPRLAQLATRIAGVVYVDEHDGELSIDVAHLGDVFAAGVKYGEAWEDYEYRHRPPEDENAYYQWQEAGPKADDFAKGLSGLLPMSSGEVAYLRLLATLGTTRVPFKLDDLRSLDAEGQRLLGDWCRAVQEG